MDRYRRRIAMLSVGAQLGCAVRRRIEGEIEIARPVEIVFETARSRTPTRFFLSRVFQPFVVNLLGKTVYQTCDEWRNCSATPTTTAPSPNERRMRRLLLGECPLETPPARRPIARPLAPSTRGRAAHTSLRPFRTCLLITSLLILVGLVRRLCR